MVKRKRKLPPPPAEKIIEGKKWTRIREGKYGYLKEHRAWSLCQAIEDKYDCMVVPYDRYFTVYKRKK